MYTMYKSKDRNVIVQNSAPSLMQYIPNMTREALSENGPYDIFAQYSSRFAFARGIIMSTYETVQPCTTF